MRIHKTKIHKIFQDKLEGLHLRAKRCNWGETWETAAPGGETGAPCQKVFLSCHLSCFTIFQNLTGGLFQKAFLLQYVSYTSKVSDHCLYAMFHTLLYFKTRLVHCVKKVDIFYLAIFPSLQDKAVH